MELRDDETAEERGVLFAHRALRELREKDAAAVHDLADVKALSRAANMGGALRPKEAVDTKERGRAIKLGEADRARAPRKIGAAYLRYEA